jgi:hypothetical protein
MEQQVAQFVRACEAIPIDRGGALWSHDHHGPAECVRGISTHSRDRLVRERNQRDDDAVRLDCRDEVGQRSWADTPGLAEDLRSVSWQGTRRYFWQLNLGKSYAFSQRMRLLRASQWRRWLFHGWPPHLPRFNGRALFE